MNKYVMTQGSFSAAEVNGRLPHFSVTQTLYLALPLEDLQYQPVSTGNCLQVGELRRKHQHCL